MLLLSCARGVVDTPEVDTVAGDPPGEDGPVAEAQGGPRCASDPQRLACAHHTATLRTGALGVTPREVHWQTPTGEPPAAGWPVALLFQGSLYSAETFWEGTPDGPFGLWSQVHTTAALLDAGYAVVTPEAHADGGGWWDTNVLPWSLAWEGAPDDHFVRDLLDALAAGDFGPLDADRLYAAGVSSGGYMTSRMAVSYPGRFRALAVCAASYATCGGPLCVVPALPADHPPTRFLHGALDPVVPIATMWAYHDALEDQGTPVDAVVDQDTGHAWIPAAPEAVVGWFEAWP